MVKKILAVAVIFLATLTARAETINIDNAELARLAASGVAVIDIRTAAEWKESGVIAGSRLITSKPTSPAPRECSIRSRRARRPRATCWQEWYRPSSQKLPCNATCLATTWGR